MIKLKEAYKKRSIRFLEMFEKNEWKLKVYGIGYLGVHDGRGVNFVFLDWWQDENELHHHVFISPTDKPELLEEKTHTGVSACVWDLKVICFEREAWLEKILKNENGPDITGYLECRLNEYV